MVVGGGGIEAQSGIEIYDKSRNIWKQVGSLSSGRISTAVAAVNNNAVIVIGRCTKRDML